MKDWIFTYKNEKKCLLDLPHTWNAQDGQDGGDDYYRGTGIYEKTVKKPEFSMGKVFINSFMVSMPVQNQEQKSVCSLLHL